MVTCNGARSFGFESGSCFFAIQLNNAKAIKQNNLLQMTKPPDIPSEYFKS